ncbi:MAG: MBL fold metallo-hydrolase [Actinobacteria bacterium]|nr:MBL fold metallo-hydrolase [Actinomycetota bacterium]
MPNDHLRAVNVYAVLSAGTLNVIDSGIADRTSREHLRSALDALGCHLTDVTRFLVTHIHYDHYAQALALRDELGSRVELGRHEERSLVALAEGYPPFHEQVAQLRRYGAAEIAEAVVSRAKPGAREMITAFPDRWLEHDTDVEVGDRSLRIVATPGHTRGHVVFEDAVHGLLFGGDHVLPHITPSIGFEPVPPSLPLADYLGSLGLVRARDDARLLPAHGPVADSVHARIDELFAHHDERLSDAREAVVDGYVTAYQVAERLTWTRRGRKLDELDPFNTMLAVLETGAHLDLLVARSQLSREENDGILEYRDFS